MVSRLIQHEAVKRHRPRLPVARVGPHAKPHSFAAKYMFPTKSGQQLVCKKNFLHLTKFSTERDRHLLKLLKNGEAIVERRGGDRISHKSVD